MLGILDENGMPVQTMGILETPAATARRRRYEGRALPRVRQLRLIRKDGCEFCTACGYVGVCG